MNKLFSKFWIYLFSLFSFFSFFSLFSLFPHSLSSLSSLYWWHKTAFAILVMFNQQWPWPSDGLSYHFIKLTLQSATKVGVLMKSFKILSCRDGKTLRSAESQALTAHGSNCPIYPYFWTRGELDCSFKIEIVILLFCHHGKHFVIYGLVKRRILPKCHKKVWNSNVHVSNYHKNYWETRSRFSVREGVKLHLTS